jgi:hypothetical protein
MVNQLCSVTVRCVILFKLHNFSEPHFPHQHSGILSLPHKTHRVAMRSKWARNGTRPL